MLQQTKAIVLHTLKYSDSGLIVHTYTEAHGRMAYIVTVSKSKRSTLRSSLFQPLSLLEIETDFKPGKDLQRIRESRALHAFSSIPFDPSKNALAIFIAEMLYRSLKEPHIDEYLFRFLHHSIVKLDTVENSVGNFHISFLMQFAYFMGFEPHKETFAPNSFFDLQNGVFVGLRPAFGECLNVYESGLLAKACNLNFENMHEHLFSKAEKQLLLSNIMKYYSLHLHNFSGIKSLDILFQLFG